ncbi:18428_t:CDS:2, partial [Racocetra persica]
ERLAGRVVGEAKGKGVEAQEWVAPDLQYTVLERSLASDAAADGSRICDRITTTFGNGFVHTIGGWIRGQLCCSWDGESNEGESIVKGKRTRFDSPMYFIVMWLEWSSDK